MTALRPAYSNSTVLFSSGGKIERLRDGHILLVYTVLNAYPSGLLRMGANQAAEEKWRTSVFTCEFAVHTIGGVLERALLND